MAQRRRPARGLPIVRKNTVRLAADIAQRVRAGHPWVYREALGARPLAVEPGTPIDLIDDEGEFVGRGLYDADSAIALRVFSRNPDVAIDAALLAQRVRAAIGFASASSASYSAPRSPMTALVNSCTTKYSP